MAKLRRIVKGISLYVRIDLAAGKRIDSMVLQNQMQWHLDGSD